MHFDSADTSIWRYPSVTEVLYTPLQPSVVLDRLKRSIEPDIVWGIFHQEPFSGHLDENTFTVYKQANNNRSIPPRMSGVVQAATDETGSVLTVQYQERTITIIGYGLIWTGFFVFRVIGIGEEVIRHQFNWVSLLQLLLSAILFGALLFGSFRYRVWKSRRALAELLLLKKMPTS